MPNPATPPNTNLPVQSPFDWDALLGFLRFRAVPNLEHADENSYSRSIKLGAMPHLITVKKAHRSPHFQLTLHGKKDSITADILQRVRAIFDLDISPEAFFRSLQKTPVLVRAVPNLQGIRVPGSWDLFELGIRAILGQQVTVVGARTLTTRLVRQFGTPFTPLNNQSDCSSCFPSAKKLSNSEVELIGMPSKRANAIREFSRLFMAMGKQSIDPTLLSERLIEIPGIGPWTINYIRMRGLKDPDAFPIRDVALLKAAQQLNLAQTHAELARVAEQWCPYRSYATLALWKFLSNQSQQKGNRR